LDPDKTLQAILDSGLTATEVGAKAGVSAATVQKATKGLDTGRLTAMAIAKVLGRTIGALEPEASTATSAGAA